MVQSGADVDISVTPKPHYGIDSNKVFGITGVRTVTRMNWKKKIGSFHSTRSGARWRACLARNGLRVPRKWCVKCPDLTLVYLPHLVMIHSSVPSGCDMPKLVKELDDAAAPLLDAATAAGGSCLGRRRVRPLRCFTTRVSEPCVTRKRDC